MFIFPSENLQYFGCKSNHFDKSELTVRIKKETIPLKSITSNLNKINTVKVFVLEWDLFKAFVGFILCKFKLKVYFASLLGQKYKPYPEILFGNICKIFNWLKFGLEDGGVLTNQLW